MDTSIIFIDDTIWVSDGKGYTNLSVSVTVRLSRDTGETSVGKGLCLLFLEKNKKQDPSFLMIVNHILYTGNFM